MYYSENYFCSPSYLKYKASKNLKNNIFLNKHSNTPSPFYTLQQILNHKKKPKPNLTLCKTRYEDNYHKYEPISPQKKCHNKNIFYFKRSSDKPLQTLSIHELNDKITKIRKLKAEKIGQRIHATIADSPHESSSIIYDAIDDSTYFADLNRALSLRKQWKYIDE